MGKSQVGSCGFLIALAVMVNAGIVLAQSNGIPTADRPFPEEMISFINETSTACDTFTKAEHRYRARDEDAQETQKGITEQRSSINGVMVTEDMRCRQCRGKCAAESLRCRSQCADDSACLVHCEERSSKCEEICKQIFQCR